MKRIFSILLVIMMLVVVQAFDEPYYYTEYKPVLMKRDKLEASIVFQDAQVLKAPGKIYFKDQYILINEKYKGVHIINNTDPSNPVNIGFINVPGMVDMAMKANTLYVDNAVDLVAIDLSDLPNINVTDRKENVFPELVPPGYDFLPYQYAIGNRPENTVIVRWEKY
ncbi:MAG: hypothetical protein JEZ03_15705 [Bacteroidales bacterium]|nr:hypothetical protein [Bacteroidales bacterium]